MKKTLTVLLCLLLMLGLLLTGCGEDNMEDPSGTAASQTDGSTGTNETDATDATDATDTTDTEPSDDPTEETAEDPTEESTEAPTEERTLDPTEETYYTPVPPPTDPTQAPPEVADPPASDGDYTALAEFLSDAAFIGDSVTLKLRNYHMATGRMGKVTFLCQGSYSVSHAVHNSMYLSYQGQDITPQDALAACGAKKVFIQLGMNDIALWGINKTMENWAKLVENIRSKNPDITIYIQSGTPIYTAGQIGDLNNKNMDAYNVRLAEFAKANGCEFINLAPYFKDSTNGLAEKYCSDAYVHFTDTACKLWLDILKDHLGL